MYADLDLRKGKRVLVQPAFFLIRRYLLALAVCTFNDHLIVQVFLMAAQIIVQVNIIGSQVYYGHSKAQLEYFNEFILMQVLYTILMFSPFV